MVILIILLIIVLLVFSIFIQPSIQERFENIHPLAFHMNSGNNINKKRTTLLYFRNKDLSEQAYLNLVRQRNPFEEFTEPMIMNRCIEFINDPSTYRFGIDQVIAELYADQKIFVSDKITVDYNHYDTLEKTLISEIYKLYGRSNSRTNNVDQFMGPAYILITQYPFIRDILEDCTIIPRALRYSDDYLPKPLDETTRCPAQAKIINDQTIRAEIYILLPLHTPKILKTSDGKEYRIVGPNVYTRWDQVLTNMRRLFAYNSEGKSGIAVVNPRSFDRKCNLHCGTPFTNPYFYACGARNNTTKDNKAQPYDSIILGGSTGRQIQKHDFANLYLINTKRMNMLLGLDPIKGIFAQCDTVQVKPISTEFDVSNESGLEACIHNPRQSNLRIQTKLSGISKQTPFQIKIGSNYLAYNNKTLKLVDQKEADTWYVDPIKENRNVVQLYTLKNKKKWYLTKNKTEQVILTQSKPTKTAFKNSSDKTLNLVEIDSNARIKWDTHSNYCVAMASDNTAVLIKCSSSNSNVQYEPIDVKQKLCQPYITSYDKNRILSLIKQNLLNDECYM